MKTASDELVAILDDLRETLFHATLYREAWWCLVGMHNNRDLMVGGMSNNLLSFNVFASALFDAFVCKLATVFDENKHKNPSISFYSNYHFTKHPDFKNIENLGRKLYVYRNKFFAHRDFFSITDPEKFQSGLNHDDHAHVLSQCCKIFNEVAVRFGQGPIQHLSCEEDVLDLVHSLINYRHSSL